ncbi:MAG: hypothetical protein WBL20_14400 [Sphingobium sp.]|uniref:hypothetical protein n=1 Tax=Sphingobium sp. TaxID=1912891 RepID=UPI002E1E0047
MIRVYIIAAESPQRLSFALDRKPGGRTRPVEALQEVVDIRDLADPARMRALAIEFHNHFKEKKGG